MNRVTFFIDGSCSGGTVRKPAPMGAGVVILVDTEQVEFSAYLGEGTNQQAELLAVKEALESIPPSWAPEATEVTIWTDSAYAIGILTEGWHPKVNQEIIAPLKQLAARFAKLTMHHVPGHSGHTLNERAHQLAVQGARSNTAPRPVVAGVGNALAELLDEQQRRVDSLVQALQWYADPLCYMSPPGADDEPPSIVRDQGQVARTVLQALGYVTVEEPFEVPA